MTDLLHVPPPAQLDGESLKPYLDSSETRDRVAIGETDYPLRFGWAPLRSVRAEGFKFIEAPRPELYDLHADPKELANHYEPSNATAQKFRGMLAEVRAKSVTPPSASPASPGANDQLNALGYQSRVDAGVQPMTTEPSQLPDPKDKIEEQNLLHAAMMASDDNRSDEARRALEKVLQLDPKSPTALRQLGELELQCRRLPEGSGASETGPGSPPRGCHRRVLRRPGEAKSRRPGRRPRRFRSQPETHSRPVPGTTLARPGLPRPQRCEKRGRPV